jgi:hypothetical protein
VGPHRRSSKARPQQRFARYVATAPRLSPARGCEQPCLRLWLVCISVCVFVSLRESAANSFGNPIGA